MIPSKTRSFKLVAHATNGASAAATHLFNNLPNLYLFIVDGLRGVFTFHHTKYVKHTSFLLLLAVGKGGGLPSAAIMVICPGDDCMVQCTVQ